MRLRGSNASHATSHDLKGAPSCFSINGQQRHLHVRSAPHTEQRASPPTPTPRVRRRAPRAPQRARGCGEHNSDGGARALPGGSVVEPPDRPMSCLSRAPRVYIHSEALLRGTRAQSGIGPLSANTPGVVSCIAGRRGGATRVALDIRAVCPRKAVCGERCGGLRSRGSEVCKNCITV